MHLRALLCTWLLLLLHALATLWSECSRLWQQFKPRLSAVYSTRAVTETFTARLRRRRSAWRVPGHLAVLVAEWPVCWHSLSRLVRWSAALGVRSLSVYDSGGAVRRGLEHQLLPLLRGEARQGPCNGSWLVESGEGSEIELVVLDCSDGVAHMAGAARELCQQVEQGALKAGSIDTDSYGAALAWSFTEPGLALCLGPGTVLLGYPPWQLRLTEIVRAGAVRPLPEAEFVRIMQRYSRIEQRFGA